jgi:mono/diheme cytochrome c family protein
MSIRHWTALAGTLLVASFGVVAWREWRAPRVQQIVNEELGVVDRCTTCHPEQAHSAPWLEDHPGERFACTSCHDGQGRATTASAAHSSDPSWLHPLLAREFLGAACARCHREDEIPFEPYLTDGRKLYADAACAACHTPDTRKMAPDLRHVGSKVNAAWLQWWLKRPKDYQPKTRMPNFRLPDREIAVLSAYLLTLRAQPAPAAFRVDPALEEQGGLLFRRTRCVSCHALKGRGGTLAGELECVGSKADPFWVAEYLIDPRRHVPNTRMPRYRFTPSQARAVAAYLAGLKCEAPPAPGLPPASPAEAQRLVRRYGCYGCHELPGFEKTGPVGVELDGFADKPAERLDFGALAALLPRTWTQWTFAKLKKPRQFRDTLRMPDYELEDEEALSLTIYLRSLTSRRVPPAYQVLTGGTYQAEGAFGRLVEDLRCLECHRIRNTGGTLAPDLSWEGSRIRPAWLRDFLKNPQPIRLYLEERMPDFQLSPSEIDTIVNYLTTVLVADLAPVEVPLSLAPAGRRLYFEKYSCQACHQHGVRGGAIGPDLTEARKRLTPEWIYHYLRDNHRLVGPTPEPTLRVPEPDALAISAFLLAR